MVALKARREERLMNNAKITLGDRFITTLRQNDWIQSVLGSICGVLSIFAYHWIFQGWRPT